MIIYIYIYIYLYIYICIYVCIYVYVDTYIIHARTQCTMHLTSPHLSPYTHTGQQITQPHDHTISHEHTITSIRSHDRTIIRAHTNTNTRTHARVIVCSCGRVIVGPLALVHVIVCSCDRVLVCSGSIPPILYACAPNDNESHTSTRAHIRTINLSHDHTTTRPHEHMLTRSHEQRPHEHMLARPHDHPATIRLCSVLFPVHDNVSDPAPILPHAAHSRRAHL